MTTTEAPPAVLTSRPASRRGVLIYGIGVLVLSTLGGLAMAASDDPTKSPGALLFIISPILMAVGLRKFRREGWADAGLRLGRERGWYLLALLLFPALFTVPLVVGALTDDVRMAPGGGERFATLFATGLIARLIFSVFEEFGWRGYLEPRLAALGVPSLRRHLAVGALWALWHVPYIVAYGDSYSEVSLAAQLPLFAIAVLAMAVIWGVARERTGSVWPAVLGHGIANAVAFPLLASDVVVIDNPLVHAARPEGLVGLILLVLTAVVVHRRWGRVAGPVI